MKLKNNQNLEVLRFSDVKYEKLTAEIQYLGEPIAQINQDKGKDALELELFTGVFNRQDFLVRFPLSDFQEALELARETLTGNQS